MTADPDRDYPPTRASIGVMQMTGYTGYDRTSTKKVLHKTCRQHMTCSEANSTEYHKPA